MQSLCLLVCAFALAVSAHGAAGERCNYDTTVSTLEARNPRVKSGREQWHEERESLLKKAKRQAEVYTVQVVVHIIYNVQSQNLADDRIMSQLIATNQDFMMTNYNKDDTIPAFQNLAGSSNIQFVLATEDPQGNPTTGITRTQTAVQLFPSSDNQNFDFDCMQNSRGGKDPWPTTQYLNVWVCNMDATLGYATPPSGFVHDTDGVVVTTSAFGTIGTTGRYSLGRTFTHEAGHFFDLPHPWGNGGGNCVSDDGIADTPNCNGPHYDCLLGSTSCNSLDMVQNYMDYSDDDCMTLFTADQIAVMRSTVMPGGPRSSVTIDYTGPVPGITGTQNTVSSTGTPSTSSPQTSSTQTSSSTATTTNGNDEEANQIDEESNFSLGSVSIWVFLGVAAVIAVIVIVAIAVAIKAC